MQFLLIWLTLRMFYFIVVRTYTCALIVSCTYYADVFIVAFKLYTNTVFENIALAIYIS